MEAALYAREHVLLVAKPGTAKSLMAKQFFGNFEGRLFKTQVSKWSDETQLFGMPDLKKLKEDGVIHYRGTGTLLDCDFAFLDELFDGSDALLRTTLGPLHEREFSRAGQCVNMPLRCAVATSNYTRLNNLTEAVLDRFSVQFPAPELGVNDVMRLISGKADYEGFEPETTVTKLMMDETETRAEKVKLSDELARHLAEVGVKYGYSPRRVRKIARLCRFLAAIDGRPVVRAMDLQRMMIGTAPVTQPEVRDNVIRDVCERLAKVGLDAQQTEQLETAMSFEPTSKDPKVRAREMASAWKSIKGIVPASDSVRTLQAEALAMLEAKHKKMVETARAAPTQGEPGSLDLTTAAKKDAST